MAALTPGQSYLLLFPTCNFCSIFKLIESHTANERYDILYTFSDSTGNIVKFTKGVFNSISITEWNPPSPSPPKTPPPMRANHISFPDLPPVPRHLLPKQTLNFTHIPDLPPPKRRPSFVTPPVPQTPRMPDMPDMTDMPSIYRDIDFDELYN